MTHPKKTAFPHFPASRLAGSLIVSSFLAFEISAQSPVATLPAPATNGVAVVDQTALIQQLLSRIEQLEKREAARTASEAAANAPLVKRVNELEQKLAAVEGAKLLPEIAVTSEDAPSQAELDRKIKALEEKTAETAALAEQRAKEAPTVSIGASGIQFASADKNFSVSLKGMIQADAFNFFNDNPLSEGNDSFVLRRVRFALQGTLYKDFEYLILPQYGGFSNDDVQILDAYVAYHPVKNFEVKLGKFKGPVGLELLESVAVLPFNERSMVSGLVPQRNVGLQVSGSVLDGAISGSAGVFNHAGDLRNPEASDFGDDREYAGRVFFQPLKNTELKPLKGLGFGLGGSYSQVSSNALALPGAIGSPLPGFYTSPGAQQFFAYNPLAGPVVADGVHWRLSPQGYWYWGPFGLLGEYALSSQGVYNSSTFRRERLTHSAWQVTGEWVITGEEAGFNGIKPKNPFRLGAPGWGAWQLVGRFSQFDVDDKAFPTFSNPAFSATAADSWSVGINWWLNRNVRVMTSFTHTSFLGGGAAPNLADPGTFFAPATVTAQDENVWASRVQISF
jgi:phosphate-selective porin OprO/OprP